MLRVIYEVNIRTYFRPKNPKNRNLRNASMPTETIGERKSVLKLSLAIARPLVRTTIDILLGRKVLSVSRELTKNTGGRKLSMRGMLSCRGKVSET